MTDLGDFEDFDGDETSARRTSEDPATESPAGTTDVMPRDADDSTSASDRETETETFETADVSPVGTDTGIGTLSAAEGLVVSEDPHDTHLRAYITVGNRALVRIGSYLVADYPDAEKLFCRIVALEYAQEFQSDDATEIHARRAMRSDGVDEQDFKFMASLEPLAVLYDDGGEMKRRMADRVPKPETVVGQATDPTEIKTGLKIPEDGVFLGHLSVGGERVRTAASPPTIDYRLKDDYTSGDPLVFRHTLVAGGTGSGKTHGAKNVLRQYLADNRSYPVEDRSIQPAVVVFDPQDEYAQMHDDNPMMTDDFARTCKREGVAQGGIDDTVAFVPKVGNATYTANHHRAEQVEFTVPFSMVQSRPWLVASGGLNDNQYPALQQLLTRFFDQTNNNGTYAEFRSFLEDPTLREELHESGRIHESTYDAVNRRTLGFADVFDADARPITELVDEFVRPGGLTVVPTYHVNDSRKTTTVVLAVASLLVDEKLSNNPYFDRIKETPIILGMDEAHNFLADADSVQAQKVIGKFSEAAKQGRKERLGLFLITQDPQDVADPVFKQINTTIVLNLGDDDAIKAVNIPSNLEGKVPYMEKGQMVIYSPDNSEPVELRGLATCLTRHGRD
jgi:DNA helicase HerA-like ATPase